MHTTQNVRVLGWFYFYIECLEKPDFLIFPKVI